MIVPQYWAEGRQQHRDSQRQITVRRFGWSDASASDAQANADLRTREALNRMLAGEKLARRDPKLPYNGAQGVPIREEIVSRHGETVITRNSYGARCLNTPNVLFADIDFSRRPPFRFSIAVFALLLGALGTGWLTHRISALAFFTLLFTGTLSGLLYQGYQAASGGAEKIARNRIRRFVAQRPDWNLRLYRTPAGMRVLATHRTFSPSEPAVAHSFARWHTDPVYTRMCLNQQCFRARVSAKPWRIGVKEHLRPRPGVWPVAPERMPQRTEWITRYEQAAASFAACAFIESLGSGTVHPDALQVQDLHDQLCAATRSLPIA